MQIDVSTLRLMNVTDSCSVWNILASELLYAAALAARCSFCCTSYVEYECLLKPREKQLAADLAIQERFCQAKVDGDITVHPLSIADLQDVDILRNRKRLSMGELSSIAFAQRTAQAFLTDDQKARKLARTMIESDRVQTTPHLAGWLFYIGALNSAHKDDVIRQHRQHGRPLEKYFLAGC